MFALFGPCALWAACPVGPCALSGRARGLRVTASASGAGDRRTGAQEDAYEPDPHRWRALWVTLVAGFMSLLDVTIVAVALPTVQNDLGASPAEVQWVVSGYALTFALALVTAGRLGDALDRRKIFLIALCVFVLCSAACGAAPDITLLVVARLAQGLAAGFMAPQNSALIQQMFRGAERGRAFGYFGATVGISSASGPIVGGAILALADGMQGWRWIFFVNVPIGVLAVLLGRRLLPRTRKSGRGHVDVPGVLLGLTGVIVGLGTAAVLLRFAPLDHAPWLTAPALFVGGIGGGFVVSPNITMTLRDVPVRMAGAAGGALQTGQRLGAAVGTAALPGLFYLVLGHSDDFQVALFTALCAALAAMSTSLVLAAYDWLRDRRRRAEHGKCPEEVANSPVHSRSL